MINYLFTILTYALSITSVSTNLIYDVNNQDLKKEQIVSERISESTSEITEVEDAENKDTEAWDTKSEIKEEDKENQETTREDSDNKENDSNKKMITISVIDSAGNPVENVGLSICTDTMCQEMSTDNKGNVTFEREEDQYFIHLMYWPEGVAPDQKNYEINNYDNKLIIQLL